MNISRKLKLCAWAGCLTLALSGLFGCQDTINTVENRDLAMTPDNIDTKNFITDSFCRDRLSLVSCRKAMTAGDVMMAQAAIRSERYGFWSEMWTSVSNDNPYHILYRFEWFDDNGMKVSTTGDAWHEEIFMPGETKYLQGVAPNSRCKDFVLSVREKPERSTEIENVFLLKQ